MAARRAASVRWSMRYWNRSMLVRIWKSCFSPVLYKGRNAIERMFCRIKDFRRIATRYDKLADNFLASVHLVAMLIWWL